MPLRLEWDKLAGIALVAALHAAALWGLWSHRLIPMPQEGLTLFVDFIAPPLPKKAAEPPRREPPKPRAEEKPQPRQLVAEAPVTSPADVIAPAPRPASAVTAAEPGPAAPPAPATPIGLGAELSVSCPERTAPTFPLMSRRMGESGVTVLRVELNETGQVSAARVATSSGYARLDEAALAAVKSWRCNPAQRNGQPVRAVATQAFKFLLQGN